MAIDQGDKISITEVKPSLHGAYNANSLFALARVLNSEK